MKRLTLMMRVEDTARADVALTPERTYYRFATDSSIEDGELAPAADFDTVADRIVADASMRDGEALLDPKVKVQIFIDNRLQNIQVSEQSLRRIADRMADLNQEFNFLNGFC